MSTNQKDIDRINAYKTRAGVMRENLSLLTAWLDQKAPESEDANWGDIADIAKINERLEELIEFLGRDNY